MAQSNATDSGCVVFKLPDGDRTLVSWEYVLGKLTEVITPINTALTLENQSLDLIISKLNEWIEDQPT